MSKRKKFLVTSFLLSVGFIGIQFVQDEFKLIFIAGLSFLTTILFTWTLIEGLGLNMTLLTLVLPTMFTFGVGIFWFLLPSNIFTRLPVILIYGIGIYVLCLTTNIYTVSAVRTIALLRAARGVGFLLILVTSFLADDAVLSLRTSLPITTLLILAVSFPILFQGFWTVTLDKLFSRELVVYSALFSLILAEISIALYFWPVTVVVGSLFLTVAVYMLLGLGQARLEDRLFSQTAREYLVVGVLVFIGMFFATRWG